MELTQTRRTLNWNFDPSGDALFSKLLLLGLVGFLLLPTAAHSDLSSSDLSSSDISSDQAGRPESGPLGFGVGRLNQEMETDRPDFTEGTQSVQKGHFQLEAGYTFSRNSSEGVKTQTHSLPEALLRLGIAEDLELRLAWEGYLREDVRGSSPAGRQEGLSDTSIGYKHRLLSEPEYPIALGYILELGIPTGSSELRSRDPEPAVKLLYSRTLTETISISGNTNYASRAGEESRYFELATSAALGLALSEMFGSYIEYFGIFPTSVSRAEVDRTHFLNGGFTLAASSNLQFDIRVGFGLTSESEDIFSGVGVVWRR